MKKPVRKTSSGFTLIELMVVMVLVTLLLVGTTNLFISTIKGGGKASVLAELKDQGDFALTTMERLIRQGNDVSNCGAAGSARVTVRYVDGMFIYLRVSGGKFQQSNDNVTWRDISSSNVTVTNTLPFKCADNYDGFNPDVVNVGFTLRHVSTGTQESFLGTISLRNVSTD